MGYRRGRPVTALDGRDRAVPRTEPSTFRRTRMTRRCLTTLTLALILVGPDALHSQEEIIRGELPPMPETTYHLVPEGIRVETVATGLVAVWALQFAPDGRLFFTEREGRVRTMSPGGVLDPEPWLAIEDRVLFRGESGVMGVALHPRFPEEPWVYVMYTSQENGTLQNRISRFREVNGRAGEEEILIDGLAVQEGGGSHSGGTLRFGADGMLYASTGDAFERQRSEDLDDLAGSVLRLTPEGGVPADNPTPGSPIWAHGVRNIHGLDWQPGTGALFAADHGPTGEDGTRFHDRVVVLQEGRHHGWPRVIGAPGLPEYVDPILTFVPSAPPGDLLFYDADLMPQLRGDLFVSLLGFQPAAAQALLRVRFEDADRPQFPTAMERWFNDGDGTSAYGRLRGMTVGPDGALYIGTSNRDGRQFARDLITPEDDRILRIDPE
jgi:glucose/arabinose dehydrogenase